MSQESYGAACCDDHSGDPIMKTPFRAVIQHFQCFLNHRLLPWPLQSPQNRTLEIAWQTMAVSTRKQAYCFAEHSLIHPN